MTGKFVAYYRVSTTKQGINGLGMDAQRNAVMNYLNGGDWKLMAEFAEVESGKRKDRPELVKAIALCREEGATLLIAKLDRLARNAAFLLNLRDSGVDFIATDMPHADKFTVGIMALVAEKERDLISQRTRDGLAAARRRGIKLGNPRRAGSQGCSDRQLGASRCLRREPAPGHHGNTGSARDRLEGDRPVLECLWIQDPERQSLQGSERQEPVGAHRCCGGSARTRLAQEERQVRSAQAE